MRQSAFDGRRVLLVEDEYFIATELGQMFEENGAEVLGPAGRLDEAMALLKQEDQIDGAVLDINLHGVMAYAVADALRARGVPFVFATGYEQAEIPPRFAGVVRCEKPVEPYQVAQALFG